MSTLLKVKELEVGKKYKVFFAKTDLRTAMGAKYDVPLFTGEFIKTEARDAIIEKPQEGTRPAERGYYGDSYVFEAVDPVPEPPAGSALRAVRALKKGAKGNPEGGRKTRKHKRRSRKTRRRHK